MAVRYSQNEGFYKDYSVLIDTKKDLLELCGNLCRSTEHERVKREIAKAKDLGCKDFIFLIADDKIKTIEDLKQWSNKRTKVKGSTLFKIMSTMRKRYDVRFIIVPKKDIGKHVVNLLKGGNKKW